MTRLEAIKAYLDELDEWELVTLNNEYCSAINDYDSQITSMCVFDEVFYNYKPLKLVRMLDNDFSADDDYFYIDNYGDICSTNDPTQMIDTCDIAEYIDENNDYLYNLDLEKLLDDWNEDGDEDDATDYDLEPDED